MSDVFKELFAQFTFERALLSYCVKSIENYYTISAVLTDIDFLRPEHRILYMIVGTLIKRGIKEFDSALIANDAKKNSVLEKIGGYEYIDAIVAGEFGDENIQYYVAKVADASTKYKLHDKLNKHIRELETNGQNEDRTAREYIDATEGDLMDLSAASKSIKEARDLADGLEELIEYRREHKLEYRGIKTGYEILDRRIDGLVPGTLQIISARPKHGKSTLLSCIAAHVAYTEKIPVLYVDTELPFDQWRDRMVSMLSEVDERVVIHGGYTDAEYRKIQKAQEIISRGKLMHEFMPGYTVDGLIALYKKYKYKEEIGLAIFDYIKEPGKSDFANRREYQLLGDVTTALKDLAGEMNIPVLAASQLNREGNIADSDRLLRYADVLMRLKPRSKEELAEIDPYQMDYGTYKLVITDSRRGGTTPEAGIGLVFQKRMLLIYEASKQLENYDSKEFLEKEEMSSGPSMYDGENSKPEEDDGGEQDF